MSFFKKLFSGIKKDLQQDLPTIEERLWEADIGVSTTEWLIESLKSSRCKNEDEALEFIKEKILKLVTPTTFWTFPNHKPYCLFFVGVNGAGKTTSLAKMAHWLKVQNKKCLLVAGDTFRAGATDQLKTWADRLGMDCIGGQAGSDPSSIIFDGIRAGMAREMDVILVDTSGRLQAKVQLMEELKKIYRVAEKALGRLPDETFLVLDATTGQNGLSQALHFKEAAPVTGLALTKYDSQASGGMLLRIIQETGLPVRFVGTGEKITDWGFFYPKDFAERICG